MKLSVVIVSYNVKHYLWQCVDSVCRAAMDGETEVWIVDNASTDGSLDFLRQDFPEGVVYHGGKHVGIHYIANAENVGFSRANNQAIRQSRGEFVLLLNPDTFVAEDALGRCLDFLDVHPRAGAIGVHMVNRDGSFARESRRGLPTPATSFYKVCGLCSLFPAHPRFAHYYMGHLSEYSEEQIEVISGAFMMLRREALDQVGLLDEDYFMYGEDVDLSYRVGHGGWECWYIPALILHYKGESTQKTSFRYVQHFYHAMLIFFRKHFARHFWFTWLVVEVAVVVMGALSLCRSWLFRCFRWLMKIGASRRRQTPAPDTLYFIGSDEAWESLQQLCLNEGIAARHVHHYRHAPKDATYLTFEVTAKGRPYYSMLQQMQAASHDGYKSYIATYHPRTKTLILPHDILCQHTTARS